MVIYKGHSPQTPDAGMPTGARGSHLATPPQVVLQILSDLGHIPDLQSVGLLHRPKSMGTPGVQIDLQSVGLLHRPQYMGTPGLRSDLLLAPAQNTSRGVHVSQDILREKRIPRDVA